MSRRPPTSNHRPSGNHGGGGGDKGKGKAKAASSTLDLSNTALTIPPSLSPASFPDLHKLDLSNCGLTSLAFVKEAKLSLTWLNVSGNKLDGPGAWDGVEELKGLFVLNASNCGLTRVPSAVASLSSLKALVLSHNSLSSLGPHISRLPDLNSLIVSHNTLTSLPKTLATLPSLKKLSASHNALVSGSLPDLSPLEHLREIRFSNNPTLDALPDHFASWGKGQDESGKPGRGLEIVDLGQCGFQDWVGLKALVGQTNVVNLGLKGTKVGEEALEDGFEAFRGKITILLPSLRILNDVRFDAKFQDLKKRRESRAPEVAILDAGPMGRAINEASAQPVLIPEALIEERDKRKQRRALGRLKNELARRRAAGDDVDENVEEGGEEGGEAGTASEASTKSKKRKPTTAEDGQDEEESASEPRSKKSKKDRSAPSESVEVDVDATEAAAAAATDDASVDPAKKAKRKKNRHAPRAPLDADTDASTFTEDPASLSTPPIPSTSTAEPPAAPSEPVVKPPKKRGRESKYLGTVRTPEERPPPRPSTKAVSPPLKRMKRTPGGVLAALRGDGTEKEEERTPKAVVVEKEEEKAKEEEKVVKTSVLKVVEVAKRKGGNPDAAKVDVSSLLGFPAAGDTLGLGGGWN
ncbi:hypothetical protein RQP46_006485 [Phenoliferia psychrophenolica]